MDNDASRPRSALSEGLGSDGVTAWVCPWGICTHDQAQACRAEMRTTKRRRGCGTYFQAGTTPAEAKQLIRRDGVLT